MDELTAETDLIGMTADIVSAFVLNNAIATDALPRLIAGVHGALAGTTQVAAPEPDPQTPAVSIRKSITPDHIICLEDGKPFKPMKRHLANKYGLTPEDYRAKWGLPQDYPMVAPNYAAARSELAKSMGLGQGGRKPAKRGRKPAAK